MVKRGETSTLALVIGAVILLVVAALLIYIFKSNIGDQNKVIKDQIGQLGDADNDGVVDTFDRCKNSKGTEEFKGCPTQEALDAS